jgi:UDP-N-acetylmuramate--alanine ligase
MSGLAFVARGLGAEVTGSDRSDSSYCAQLRAVGIDPAIGHDPSNLPPGAEAVVSTAIADDNLELRAARERGTRVHHRGDLLGELSRLKRTIAISGTHGKTTTAAMAAHVLVQAGRDPAYLVGGELRTRGMGAAWGAGEWAVIEADESDRSFLKLATDVAVVTSMELDHHATYRSLVELEGTFADFVRPARSRIAWERLARARPDGPPAMGPAVLGPGDARLNVAGIFTFGLEAGDLRAEGVRLEPLGSRFSVEGVELALRVPGEHNVLNALAALAVCREAGVALEEAAPKLAEFPGAGRRFEDRGRTPAGARVFDDYAHHPTEVRATLDAARTLGARRIVACFQPHLFSRTRALAREFGRALAAADVVCVLGIYPARELAEDYPGVSGWQVAAATADASGGRPVYWTPTLEDAERLLRSDLREGDVLLTLGAGDVDRLADRLAGGGRGPGQEHAA